MAFLFCESFDGWGSGSNAALSGLYVATGTILSSVPRTGPSHAHATGYWTRLVSPGSQTIIMGAAVRWNGAASGGLGIKGLVSEASWNFGLQASVRCSGDGRLQFYRADTFVEQSAPCLVNGEYNAIEAKITVGDTGSWIVKCNGAEVLNGTGDSQGQATSAIVSIVLAGFWGQGDDWWALDSVDDGTGLHDFIGDQAIHCRSPLTGNGFHTDFTPSTGTNRGALMDEVGQNGDTDYNSSGTATDKISCPVIDLSGLTGQINALQLTQFARKTDVPVKRVRAFTRIGSTDYNGALTKNLLTGYTGWQEKWVRRPSDSGLWQFTDFGSGNAEFGTEIIE